MNTNTTPERPEVKTMAGNRHSSGNTGGGCLVGLIIAIAALPILGLYLAAKKNASPETRVIGWILFVVGIVIWVYLELH